MKKKRMKMLTVLLLFFSTIVYGQSSYLERFQSSFFRNFSSVNIANTDTCFATFSLLVVEIDTTYTINSMYFSDQALDFQKKELERIKPKLDLISLANYAKESKFSGKLIFPFFYKTAMGGCNILQTIVGETDATFLKDSKPLSGNMRFEKPLVLKLVSVRTKK